MVRSASFRQPHLDSLICSEAENAGRYRTAGRYVAAAEVKSKRLLSCIRHFVERAAQISPFAIYRHIWLYRLQDVALAVLCLLKHLRALISR